jgi:hypothetical protein
MAQSDEASASAHDAPPHAVVRLSDAPARVRGWASPQWLTPRSQQGSELQRTSLIGIGP